MKDLVLTLDIDWAPDFVIKHVMDILVSKRVKATWFVTHKSAHLEDLKRFPDLFEVGIHPNFLPGSTQGSSPAEILRHCMDLAPEAVAMRSHALAQSTQILAEVLRLTPMETDASVFMPHAPAITPFEYAVRGRSLLRIPYYWEDDFEMDQEAPCWDLRTLERPDGLKVINFHPIHVFMNAVTLENYEKLKRLQPKLPSVTVTHIESLRREGTGTRTFFMDVVESLARSGQSARLKDIAAAWRKNPSGAREGVRPR